MVVPKAWHRRQAPAAHLSDRPGKGVRRHQAQIWVHVRENDLRALIARAIGRGREGYGGRDDDIAGLDVESHHAQMQGRRAVGTGDGVSRAHRVGEGLLERLDARPGGQEVRAQGRRHGRDIVILDDLPAIGQERKRRVVSHDRPAGL
jgi:hypothetical protein